MALDGESHRVVHAAFVDGDIESLLSKIDRLGDFPNVSLDHAIGLPLVYAIHHSPLSFVEQLLEAGADPNNDDGDGFPPLIAAVSCAVSESGPAMRQDLLALVDLLISHGADVAQRGLNDYTALHLAAEQGDLAMVELLLDRGADPNEITHIDDMETALELAERAGQTEVAERLRPLTTRLDWERAATTGDVRVLRRMRRAGHDIDAKDGYGLTAIMRAAHAGHHEAVEWLIGEGANLDHTSRFHLSALMLAVIGKHGSVARLLVRAGADSRITGSGAPRFNGKCAADLAEDAGDTRLANYIAIQSR